MAEQITPGEPQPEIEKISRESRFGNKREIIETMLTGEVVEIGSIDDLYPETTPPHSNVVEIVDVPAEHANRILAVKIQKGEKVLRCIFKPADGESEDSKRRTDFSKDFYPRECAAYLISEHFNFDIIPPTVIKEINGRVGAIQLFLDHSFYQNLSRTPDRQLNLAEKSADWQTIAVLDWILVNCERHGDNIMVSKENPEKLAAIDHGIILSPTNYFNMVLRGPSLQLTFDNQTNKPRLIPIPQEIIDKVQEGLARRPQLDQKLHNLPGMTEEEIGPMWQRVQDLLGSQKFLSKENYRAVFGRSWLGKPAQ